MWYFFFFFLHLKKKKSWGNPWKGEYDSLEKMCKGKEGLFLIQKIQHSSSSSDVIYSSPQSPEIRNF